MPVMVAFSLISPYVIQEFTSILNPYIFTDCTLLSVDSGYNKVSYEKGLSIVFSLLKVPLIVIIVFLYLRAIVEAVNGTLMNVIATKVKAGV